MPTLKARVGGAWVPVLGGTGNEVTVSPDTPTDPDTELWYDTDDVMPYWLPGGSAGQVPMKQSSADGDIQWTNAARGLVASTTNGAQVSCPVNTITYLTTALPFTMLVGRKYKFEFSFRALGRQDASATLVTTNFVLYDNVTSLGWIDHWHTFGIQWNSAAGFIYRDGDGVARSYRIGIGSASAPAAALYCYPTWFGIVDVGPV